MSDNGLVKKWTGQIEESMAALAKERDALERKLSEMQELWECCNDAYESLDYAKQRLSEIV